MYEQKVEQKIARKVEKSQGPAEFEGVVKRKSTLAI
jgi:hypothetical protein